jgi:hypothetical protein
MTLIETITVVNDRGETRELYLYEGYIHDPQGGPMRGVRQVVDGNGNPVNTVDGVSFQVADTDEILTKV